MEGWMDGWMREPSGYSREDLKVAASGGLKNPVPSLMMIRAPGGPGVMMNPYFNAVAFKNLFFALDEWFLAKVQTNTTAGNMAKKGTEFSEFFFAVM